MRERDSLQQIERPLKVTMLVFAAILLFPGLGSARRWRPGSGFRGLRRRNSRSPRGLAAFIGKPVYIGDPNVLGVVADQFRPTLDQRAATERMMHRVRRRTLQEVPIGAFTIDDIADDDLGAAPRRHRRRRNE